MRSASRSQVDARSLGGHDLGMGMADATVGSAGPGDEMGMHPAMLARIRRLAIVSSVMLGVVFFLALDGIDTHRGVYAALGAGWLLMPTLLLVSLRRPRIRYLLSVPSALVGGALVAICATALPHDGVARIGWLLVTAGVLMGAGLGAWFWFRWFPVPHLLDQPFSPMRWTLVAVHVVMIVLGVGLVFASTYA